MTAWEILAQVAMLDIVAIGQQCESRIEQRSLSGRCTEIAVVTAHWPSADRGGRMCERHAAWLAKVAEAMGFMLHTTPLEVRRREPEVDESAARFAAMELD